MSNDFVARIASLSPEQRELLKQRSIQRGIDVAKLFIIPQARNNNSLPLSFAQQRLWFLDQLRSDAFAHQDLPFEKLAEELQLARGLSHDYLFQVMVILKKNNTELELQRLHLSTLNPESQTAQFDLRLKIV